MNSSPEDVLRGLKVFFRANKINRTKVAEVLHFKSTQSVTNLFSSNKYLNDTQAELLRQEFNLNPVYLTTGEGELQLQEENPNSAIWIPQPKANANPYILGSCYFSEYLINRTREILNIIGDKAAIDIFNEMLTLSYSTSSEAYETIGEDTYNFEIAGEKSIDFHIRYGLAKLKRKYKSDYPIDMNDIDGLLEEP